MKDTMLGLYENSEMQIVALHLSFDKSLQIGKERVTDIRPTPVAGNSGWTYWMRVRKGGATLLINPAQIFAIEYRFVE